MIQPSGRITYLNGEYVPEEAASISVFDHGILYGDGVFDTLVTWNGIAFKLDEHLARLYRSLDRIRLTPPLGIGDLREVVLETVRRNDLRDAYVKCVVTRGSNGQPLMNPVGCVPTIFVICMPYVSKVTQHQRDHGLNVATATVRRTPSIALDARIKSLNYLNLVLGKMEAQVAGADEALFLDTEGNVSEATGANLVLVTDGVLRSPCSDVLEGITLATVFEIAADLGLSAGHAQVHVEDLHAADEVFLTSTAGGILPVATVDGRVVGGGSVGPVTRKIEAGYQAMLGSDRHGTPVYPHTAG